MKVNLRYIVVIFVLFITLFAINSNVKAFHWPTDGTEIDFGFGGTDGKVHKEPHPGIDINVPDGTNVYAAHSGEVVNRSTDCPNEYSDCDGNCTGGKTVTIKFVENGQIFYDKYLHNSEILVEKGKHVTEGDVIALSGHSGCGDHPHLHYQRDIDSGSGTYDDSIPVNPVNYDFPATGVAVAGETGLSLADSRDRNIAMPSSSVLSRNRRLNGLTCQSFKVGPGTKPAEWSQCSEVRNGYCYGPWIKNQVNWRYEVSVNSEECPNDSGSYTAFCVDPTRDGAYRASYDYIAQTVSEESGKRFAALFKIYKRVVGDGRPTDEQYFDFEAASRIIAADPASQFNGVASTSMGNRRYASHLSAYQGGGDPSIISQNAIDYASAAIERSSKPDFIASIQGSMLGVRANTVGGYTYENGEYVTYLNVVVENWDGQAVNWGDISIEGADAEPVSDSVVEDRAARTKSFTFKLKNVVSDCSDHKLNVTLTYTTSGIDIRNVMMLVPKNTAAYNLQRYVVFENTAGSSRKITYPVSLKNCPSGDENFCGVNNTLICGPNETNFVVINEGADGDGPTQWDDCIFDHTDSQGNSYNVVDTRGLVRSENTDEYSVIGSEVDAYLSDGTEVTNADYCVVSCKEKYAFLLPGGKKDVKQGTYFSFKVAPGDDHHNVVGISAERLCVSREVKNEEYNNVAKDLRLQQVDFLNMYLYYKQLYDILRTNRELDEYKKIKKDPCDGADELLKKGIEIDGFPSYNPPDCSSMVNNDEQTRFTKWLPEFKGSNNTYEIKYYVAVGADTVDGFELQESSLRIKPGQSFREALADNNLQLQNKNNSTNKYSMYQSKYADYKEAWESKFGVEEFKKEKSVNYKLSYCKETKEQCTDVGLSSEHCEDHCSDPFYDEEHELQVNYLPGSGEEEYWNHYDLNRGGNNVYEKYRDGLDLIQEAYKKAYEKYIALMQQIELQAESIQECTNYLEISDNSFSFNPDITFSYPDQKAYMEMLAPNKLVNAHDDNYAVNYEVYYSDGQEDPNALFSHSPSSPDDTKVEFKYLFFFEDDDHARQETFDRGLTVNAQEHLNDITYHNAGTVGSRATYGRYSINNADGCSSSFVADAGSPGDYCYEFYRSGKEFYTTPPNGEATTSPVNENSSLIADPDGYVYPVSIRTPEGKYPYYVKFANIGQFGDVNGAALGRIMGGGNGKPGTMSGDSYDVEVCYYKVCRIDDPDCGPSPDYCYNEQTKQYVDISACLEENSRSECENLHCPPVADDTCDDIVKSYCNDGNVLDSEWRRNVSNYQECGRRLMAADNCCPQLTEFKLKGAGIPNNIYYDYEEKCDPKGECEGFQIITSDYYTATTTQLSDRASVNNNGSLQLNARTVSNNNLFPNGQKGVNWTTSEARKYITLIQKAGDGIFAEPPEYYVHLSTACVNKIREYNRKHDTEEANNSGFSDYFLSITNTDEGEYPIGERGTNAIMSDEFRKILESPDCRGNIKAEPDKIEDESRVRT